MIKSSPSSSIVLVVDDDLVSRQLLEGLLASENYAVLLAASGAEALTIAARTPPDLVLLDVLMPGLDGFEVCRQLRANPVLYHVPIILLTALEGRASRLEGFDAGADEFLSKPVDPTELRARVRTITQLNRFRQLSDERARFEAAVEGAPEGIVLTNERGRILNTNTAFADLVGRTPVNIFDCFRPETAEQLRMQVATLDQPGSRVGTFETQLQLSATPGGCVEVTVVRLPWSDGSILEFIVRDITDRKQLEAQVIRLHRIELLGQLARGVVHDVNNLMTAITISAEILDSTGTEETRKRTRVIRESAQRSATLLRQILMFAQGTDQKLKPIQVAPILRETAAITSKLLGDKINLEIEAPADLPFILGDASQIHQVVTNLCVNARDAMPDGGKLRLVASAVTLTPADVRKVGPDAVAGNFLTVSVRDTGVGIAPEIRDRLFDPFFTTKPRETSTGLGLATVLRVMRRHGGFIGFESEVGDGACFTCYFPTLRE